MMNKKGFTLAELLVTIMVVAMLAAMAVPMYDKAIEKSHLGEGRTMLARMFDSKQRAMDNLDIVNYNRQFGIENLDLNMACEVGGGSEVYCQTKNFRYTLFPTGADVEGVSVRNAVCAARCGGDNSGTAFLFLGSYITDPDKLNFYCSGAKCTEYGFVSKTANAWCSCS